LPNYFEDGLGAFFEIGKHPFIGNFSGTPGNHCLMTPLLSLRKICICRDKATPVQIQTADHEGHSRFAKKIKRKYFLHEEPVLHANFRSHGRSTSYFKTTAVTKMDKNCGAFSKRRKFRCEAVPPCHKGLSTHDFGIEDDFPANPASRIRKGRDLNKTKRWNCADTNWRQNAVAGLPPQAGAWPEPGRDGALPAGFPGPAAAFS
jgi:hypothetical protein